MSVMRRLLTGVLVSGVLATSACTGSAEPMASAQEPAGQGGTISLLSASAMPTLDPQRIGDPTVAALVGRTLHRTLTAYAPYADGKTQADLVGDLATDTGTASEDLRTWSFTLRPGVTWEDGSPVTCEDVKHGVARTFATDVVTGGSTDALAVLAIPRTPEGRSTYLGPYATAPEAATGAASFDQAVSCADRTITFLLAEPTSDFNEMVTLPAFAPVKKESDPGGGGLPLVLSSGPYRLEGSWNVETGGLLVRNTHWDPESDPVRTARPDRIRIASGQEGAAIVETVLADQDEARSAVSLTPAPPALLQQVESLASLRDRTVTTDTGVVDYLAPSVASPVFANRDARLALAAATNRQGYALARSGPLSTRPVGSVIPNELLARAVQAAPVTDADPVRARELLTQAGLTAPVPIKVAYRSGPASAKAMEALAAGWRAAGFEPTLVPIDDAYFATISAPGATSAYDVFWSNWSPAWGSASTVLPPLFDSTFNITAAGTGRDYGGWANAEWNARSDQIAAIKDRTEREKAWVAADDVLLGDGAYIALAARYSTHLAGSDVRGLQAQPHGGGTIDLAVAGVK